MASTDQLETTHVRLDGAVLPDGVAVRRVMRSRGWINVSLETAGGEYRITDKHSGTEVVLEVVPPRARTTAAQCNAKRNEYRRREREANG